MKDDHYQNDIIQLMIGINTHVCVTSLQPEGYMTDTRMMLFFYKKEVQLIHEQMECGYDIFSRK